MRILGVTPYYFPEGGGLERYAHEGFRRLAAKGHEVHVVSFTQGEASVDILDGVTVDRRVPRKRVSNTPLDPKFHRDLVATIEAYEPDVVSAHGPVPFPAEMAAIACRKTQTPFALTYHAGRLTGGSLFLKTAALFDRLTFEAHAFRTAKTLVAVSRFVERNALKRHQGKVTVIPPGVDHARFAPTPLDPNRREILYVGGVSRAYAWKGFHVLYSAFRDVAACDPEATLTVVGNGDLIAHYRERAAKDGIFNRIHFTGRLDETGLRDAYRRATITCLPSVSPAESFGMVLAEANACGRPVVASRIGGIPEVVDHGINGLLVPPKNAKALADSLSWILQHPGQAAIMGDAGRARILAHHDWSRIADRTEAVLLEAAGLRSSRILAPGVGDPGVSFAG